MPEIKQDIRAATFVVAADNSLHKNMADYVCPGVNDHLTIQEALDALPATGGEIFLLDGTYNIEVALVMDSYQTLRGCGANTVLTTSTGLSGLITATGSDGSELVDILVADLRIDAASTAYSGVYFDFVDYSKIRNVWVHDCTFHEEPDICLGGLQLSNCDFDDLIGNTCKDNIPYGICLGDAVVEGYPSSNIIVVDNLCEGNEEGILLTGGSSRNTITGNICQNNEGLGINLRVSSNNNIITGNSCQGNGYGIYLGSSDNNTISSNTCQGNAGDGIALDSSDNNTVTGNTCRGTSEYGIYLTSSDNNTVTGNTCLENSQAGDSMTDNIYLINSDYNLIASNLCRQGALASKPRYGINIVADTCIKNIVQGNDLHDSGKTANFNDAGTCTIVQDDNREINQTQVKHMMYMKNTSAGNLVVGDVVSLKAIAAGTEFTTPTGVGEDQVWGMLAENINLNAWGYVQVKGGTVLLKATNAVGGAIVIGNFLCTEAGNTRAQKAAAADMAFAIALEDCDLADCTIDALIIMPRKI